MMETGMSLSPSSAREVWISRARRLARLTAPCRRIGVRVPELLSASNDEQALAAASQWGEQLLGGQVATIIAVLAVAVVGFQIMSGQLSLKAALRVAPGCFILFGSSAIAQGLIGSAPR
jgi:type IV secretion system protein VirB2